MSATGRVHGGLQPTPISKVAEDQEYRRLSSRLSLADFLWNGPSGGVASAGDTKATFLEHLGLNELDPYHRQLFSRMKADAMAGKASLMAQPPVTWMLNPSISPASVGVKGIREDAFAEVMKQIYRSASEETRTIYDLVGNERDNWVIRWMLWHIFEDGVMATPPTEKLDDMNDIQHSLDVIIKQEPGVNGNKFDYFDPVRNR